MPVDEIKEVGTDALACTDRGDDRRDGRTDHGRARWDGAGRRRGKRGGGSRLRERQHRGRQHDRRVRSARRRNADGPIGFAVHGGLVYVANEGNGTTGSNYTGFRLNSGGHLTPIAGSTVPLPATANPGDILFNGTGNNLIGIEVGTTDSSTFLIDSFVVGE